MEFIGLLYLAIIFLSCFAIIAFFKLAYLGLTNLRKQPPEKHEEKKSEKPPEPVYYIVEKKRARKTYSKPKEIIFKGK